MTVLVKDLAGNGVFLAFKSDYEFYIGGIVG